MPTILLLSLAICACTGVVSSRNLPSLPSFFRSLPRSYQLDVNVFDDPLILKKAIFNSINNVTSTRLESSDHLQKGKNSGKISPGKPVSGHQCSSGGGECAKSSELHLSSENKVAESGANVAETENRSNDLETESSVLIRNEKVAFNGSLNDEYAPNVNFEDSSTRNVSDSNIEAVEKFNSDTFSDDTRNILSTTEDGTVQSFTLDEKTLNEENEKTIKTTTNFDDIFETVKYLNSSNASTNAKNILNSVGDLMNVKSLSEKSGTVKSFIFEEKILSEENETSQMKNGSDSTNIFDSSEDFSTRDHFANTSSLIATEHVADLPFSENNSIELLTFDKSDLREDEMPFFQDVSTVDFQFLVDSQTTQNLIRRELLESGISVIEEKEETGVLNSVINKDSIIKIQDFDLSQSNKTDSNVMDNAPLDGLKTVTEISETRGKPECPAPGWCLLWFLKLQDTCAENSHCFGSSICCKSGCSKSCIDID